MDRTLYVVRQKTRWKLYLAGKFPQGPRRQLRVVWSSPHCPTYQARVFSLPADAASYFFDLRDPPYNPKHYELEEHRVPKGGALDLVDHRTRVRSLPMPEREPEEKNHVSVTFDPRADRGRPRPPEEVPPERALPGVPDGGGRVAPEAGPAPV